MENQILENIEKLYASHIVTLVSYVALIAVVAAIVAGVIKLKLLNARWKNIILVSFVSLASVCLIVIQTLKIVPVYKDYEEQSYIVIENAKVVIQDATREGIDSINYVIVYDGEKEIELKMQTDYSLDTWFDYTGDVAYLEHSGYLIWYDFNEINE